MKQLESNISLLACSLIGISHFNQQKTNSWAKSSWTKLGHMTMTELINVASQRDERDWLT